MNVLQATRSGTSPLDPACNTTMFYYAAGHLLPGLDLLLDSPSVNADLLSPLSRSTMQVCFLYFCRISEVLNATIADIIHPDRVVLHGAKRSNSYVVYLPCLSEQVSRFTFKSEKVPLFPISYIKLYRDALRIGINVRVKDSVNSRRLHCARYIFSKKSLKSINGSELAGVLRHKSLSNYSSYLK